MTQRRIYQHEFPFFVTFRTREGYPLFEDKKMAVLLSRIIINAGVLKQYDILAYQIMPDHVHLLVRNIRQAHPSVGALLSKKESAGRDACARDDYNISQFIHTIKSFLCNQIRDQFNMDFPVLQKRFYTRIINSTKYLYAVIEYIKNNPAKAQLPEKYHYSPFRYCNWPKIHALF